MSHNYIMYDEDVENNYAEDIIPDVLNPYLDDSFVAAVRAMKAPMNVSISSPMPKMRTKTTRFKRKLSLEIATYLPAH